MKRSNKGNNSPALAKAKPSLDWKDRADYKKENRAWLRKSADVALKILDALDRMNITQVELANRLNVSRQHVSKIIKGQENLTLETIARIEEVLEVTLLAVPENEIRNSARRQRTENLKRLTHQAQESRLDYETQDKIKPIIYHSFEEKEQLEKDLMAAMPEEKRNAVAVSLMAIFHTPARGRRKKNLNQSSKKLSNKK
jgi:transcriptional regulator with XRE-family HTH domain